MLISFNLIRMLIMSIKNSFYAQNGNLEIFARHICASSLVDNLHFFIQIENQRVSQRKHGKFCFLRDDLSDYNHSRNESPIYSLGPVRPRKLDSTLLEFHHFPVVYWWFYDLKPSEFSNCGPLGYANDHIKLELD